MYTYTDAAAKVLLPLNYYIIPALCKPVIIPGFTISVLSPVPRSWKGQVWKKVTCLTWDEEMNKLIPFIYSFDCSFMQYSWIFFLQQRCTKVRGNWAQCPGKPTTIPRLLSDLPSELILKMSTNFEQGQCANHTCSTDKFFWPNRFSCPGYSAVSGG